MRWSNVAAGFALVLAFLACGCAAESAGSSAKCRSEVSPLMQMRSSRQRTISASRSCMPRPERTFSSHLLASRKRLASPIWARVAPRLRRSSRVPSSRRAIRRTLLARRKTCEPACPRRTPAPRSSLQTPFGFAKASRSRSLGSSTRAQAAFGADVTPLDFNSPDAARTINAWVSRRTHGHIPTIVNSVAGAEALITNAVYFKALWEQAFFGLPNYSAASWARPVRRASPS